MTFSDTVKVSRPFSTLFPDCPETILRARLMKRAISSLISDDEASVIEKGLQGYLQGSDLQTLLQEKGPFEKIVSSGSGEEVYVLAKEGIERLQGAT